MFSSLKNIIFRSKSGLPGVGLDIGVGSCRMVEVISRPDGYHLLGWAISPIVAGDVAKAVSQVMSKTSQPNFSPVTALSGKGTLIRFVNMPKMPLADLKRSFAFEVDKYFPFPKDQIFTDCHILDQVGADNKLPVLVAAAKKEMVNERIKLLGLANLQADIITLNSIAIANVIDVLGAPKSPAGNADQNKKGVAVLDVGEVVSSITIFVDNRPKFNRDISIGGRDFTKAIGSGLKVGLEEAEKIKRDPKDRGPEIAASVESVIFDMVSDLRLSFDYFTTETNLSISQLYLTGGGTSMEHLRQSLSKPLEVETIAWDPFASLKIGPGVSAADLKTQSGYLCSALGLALLN